MYYWRHSVFVVTGIPKVLENCCHLRMETGSMNSRMFEFWKNGLTWSNNLPFGPQTIAILVGENIFYVVNRCCRWPTKLEQWHIMTLIGQPKRQHLGWDTRERMLQRTWPQRQSTRKEVGNNMALKADEGYNRSLALINLVPLPLDPVGRFVKNCVLLGLWK